MFCLNVYQIGAFFMINLCLVVIATQFSETKKREMERMAVERARRRRQSRSSSTVTSRVSVQVTTTTPGCYEELLAFVGYLAYLAQRRAVRLLRRIRRRYRCRSNPPTDTGRLQVYAVTNSRRRRKTGRQPQTSSRQRRTGARRRSGEAPYASPELSDIDLTASPRRRPNQPTTTTTTASRELGATASTDLLPIPPAFLGSLNKNV